MRTDFIRRTLTTAFCSGWMVLTASHALRAQAPVGVLAFGAVADGVMRKDGAMSPQLTRAYVAVRVVHRGRPGQVHPGHRGGTWWNGSHRRGHRRGFSRTHIGFVRLCVFRCGTLHRGFGRRERAAATWVGRIQSFNSPSSVTLSVSAQTGVAGVFFNYGGMTLEATIQSVQSSSAVTLSAPASALTGSATYAYGTDNHAAFQRAVDTVGISGGGQGKRSGPCRLRRGGRGLRICRKGIRPADGAGSGSDQNTLQQRVSGRRRAANQSLLQRRIRYLYQHRGFPQHDRQHPRLLSQHRR